MEVDGLTITLVNTTFTFNGIAGKRAVYFTSAGYNVDPSSWNAATQLHVFPRNSNGADAASVRMYKLAFYNKVCLHVKIVEI